MNRRMPWLCALAMCEMAAGLLVTNESLWAAGPEADAPSSRPAIKLDGNRLVSTRQVITVDPSGLPGQIEITPSVDELPLEKRTANAKLAPEDLAAIGRGPQLRAPVRLEAVVDGKTVILAPTEAAGFTFADGAATCVTKLAGLGVAAAVEIRYQPDGAMDAKVTYGGGASVESLALVMDVSGPVHTVIAGAGEAKGALSFAASDYGLPEEEGIVWGNARAVTAAATAPANSPAAAISRGKPGVVQHLFFGNGDRGFTWLASGDDGWMIVPAAPSMTLARDKAGLVTWRAYLVNHPVALQTDKTVRFSLLTHPGVPKAAGFRKAAWLDESFKGGGKVLSLAAVGRPGEPGLMRADCATVYESFAAACILEGPAGGDAISAEKNLAETFPMPLFRYLAATHTGLTVRLRTNAASLIRSGQSQACDRMAIGRALLHDIGVDPAGIAHTGLLGNVVVGLARFGYFEADGKTEYLPYWRSGDIIRYGEIFKKDPAFEENLVDPVGRVYVSAWRRPVGPGKPGTHAIILLVNESDKPVRQQLHILKPARLFGGAGRATGVVAPWDLSGIPAESDWGKGGEPSGGLVDLEDSGAIGSILFIPARSFRLLYGS